MRPLSKHNQPILRAGIEAVEAMMDHFRKALELTTMKSEQIFLAKKSKSLKIRGKSGALKQCANLTNERYRINKFIMAVAVPRVIFTAISSAIFQLLPAKLQVGPFALRSLEQSL